MCGSSRAADRPFPTPVRLPSLHHLIPRYPPRFSCYVLFSSYIVLDQEPLSRGSVADLSGKPCFRSVCRARLRARSLGSRRRRITHHDSNEKARNQNDRPCSVGKYTSTRYLPTPRVGKKNKKMMNSVAMVPRRNLTPAPLEFEGIPANGKKTTQGSTPAPSKQRVYAVWRSCYSCWRCMPLLCRLPRAHYYFSHPSQWLTFNCGKERSMRNRARQTRKDT